MVSSIAPSEMIVRVTTGNENFSTLVTAVKTWNLVVLLGYDGLFTAFALTNDTLAKLLNGKLRSLLIRAWKSA